MAAQSLALVDPSLANPFKYQGCGPVVEGLVQVHNNALDRLISAPYTSLHLHRTFGHSTHAESHPYSLDHIYPASKLQVHALPLGLGLYSAARPKQGHAKSQSPFYEPLSMRTSLIIEICICTFRKRQVNDSSV